MSVWTAFWALGGGGLVGLIASGLALDGVRAAVRLDGLQFGGVWGPFPPLDAWTRGADLAALAAALGVCGLCVQRISHSDEAELRFWPSTAAVTAVAALAYLTRSWWSLAAILPIAAALRHAARAPSPRWSRRRRVKIAAAAAAACVVVLTPATLELQRHPLFASPTASCGPIYTGPRNHVEAICLIVENVAFTRSASVLGVDAHSLPRSLPWTLAAQARTIAAGGQREIDVRVHPTTCRKGTAVVLRSVPLRVRVGGSAETDAIALAPPLIARCAAP